MTIKRQWELMLESAVRAFLDRYWEDEYVDTDEALAAWTSMLDELTKRMNGSFHDEWLALRAERDAQRKQDWADGGHPDEEELMAEAEVRRDLVENR